MREARGHAQRNLVAEIQFLSSMLRRAQIRIGARPLSEWLRGENRFEAKRGIPPTQVRVMPKANRTSILRKPAALKFKPPITKPTEKNLRPGRNA